MPALELDAVSKSYAVARETLWALRDINLCVEPGESVGLIGHNGAGKTTMLRLLAGITRPTSGHVRTNGRIASLINLGAGFHPELSGRENIFLNGVILGLSRREVQARFEQIVEFADLGAYIDTPLKRYSSGMYARLGFSVAVHVDPDVLLVDEVLSVGDVGFQDRSIRKMLSFRDSGQAVLFVSHNLSAVEMMCQRTAWLDHGRIRMLGPTGQVVRAYLDAVDEALVRGAETAFSGEGESVVVETVSVSADLEYGQALRVHARCFAREQVEDAECTFTVRGDYGPLFTATERFRGWTRGRHDVECVFDELPLLPGLYRVEVQIAHPLPQTSAAFRVVTDLKAFGSDSPVGATKSRGGFLAVPYDWRVRSSAGEHVLPGLRTPRA